MDRGTLEIRDLVKVYDPRSGHRAVDDFSLDVDPGEFITLLGPSGCGKTTVLRTIAGFEDPTHGSLLLDGRDLRGVPPNKRPVSLVFQSYALFPHLSVEDNVGYGLDAQKLPRPERIRRVGAALEHMGLAGLGRRSPRELSGGQQQRVALARAMVTRPQVMLFDEPLSNLDAALRDQMRLRIRSLQKEIGATGVYVTHDQAEAMAMSDRIVVMNAGRIEQVGPPVEIYHRPVSEFVAGFVGRANLLDVDVRAVDGAWAEIILFGAGVTVPAHPEVAAGPAVVLIRPENLRVTPDDAGGAALATTAFMGERVDYEIECAGTTLLASVPSPDPAEVLAEGTCVEVSLLPNTGWVLPAGT